MSHKNVIFHPSALHTETALPALDRLAKILRHVPADVDLGTTPFWMALARSIWGCPLAPANLAFESGLPADSGDSFYDLHGLVAVVNGKPFRQYRPAMGSIGMVALTRRTKVVVGALILDRQSHVALALGELACHEEDSEWTVGLRKGLDGIKAFPCGVKPHGNVQDIDAVLSRGLWSLQ